MPVLPRPISRIYTPPTCTLEVTAQPSALSRWTGNPTVKSLQFLLSFEGLSQGDRNPIELRGDQTQLANLSQVVTDYIQVLLASRSTDLSLQVSTSQSSAQTSAQTSILQASKIAETEPTPVVSAPAMDAFSAIQLHPRSLLTHELVLGSLANEQSGDRLLLKVSELYDLATALEESTADLQQLPALAAAPTWRTALPLRSAAAIVLTVGLGAVAWRFFQPGLVAVNQTEQSSGTTTALAPPSAGLTPKALPSLSPRPSTPLNLPKIQLPSRSNAPLSASPNAPSGTAGADSLGSSRGDSLPSDNLDREELNRGELNQGGDSLAGETARVPSDASQADRQQASGEIAIAPAAPAPAQRIYGASSEPRSRSQALESAPDAALNAAPAPSSRQQIGQSSLFDTIGQVAEVRDYVATRWRPASPPARALEYRLTLNPNGSLAQVEPLGASAQQYLSALPLPAVQTPFVSAIANGGRPTVRLVLNPDGTVQTFLDGSGR
ncbi:MAG: DUF4335 domain-containing protein [Thermosynechococcaceae cyanobacterium MS004]|nr:DUF4335 domain-containing protein [Thermosynechococcaceae cyanobacterium MS004]